MSEAIQTHQNTALAQAEPWLPVQHVMQQVTAIQQLMAAAMKEHEHYGVIPGTSGKPSLLKAGAEKLIFMFKLSPQFAYTATELPGGHVRYEVRCTLVSRDSGVVVAEGLGCCSSMESRYRYRWVGTDKRPEKPEAERLKAQGLGRWRKQGQDWIWSERVENADPEDQRNTIMKMAAKRALVAAALHGTAASDIFTQDLEDLQANGALPEERDATTTAKPAVDLASEKQIKFIGDLRKRLRWDPETTAAQVRIWIGRDDAAPENLTRGEAKAIIDQMLEIADAKKQPAAPDGELRDEDIPL